MISPELLRRYAFFGFLEDEQLKEIAMIGEEETFEKGTVITKEGSPADAFYLLMSGSIDLYFTVEVEYRPELRKELPYGEVNPGEPFGLSSLIEPHILISSARAAQTCKLIKIDGKSLQSLCDQDIHLAYGFMRQIAKVVMERLNATRIQLAAAWA